MTLKRARGSSKTTGLCKLVVGNDMTIYAIDQLKQDLTQSLETYIKFELNLSAVEEIDSAGIQLLLALKKELSDQKKSLKLTAPSHAVTKLIERYSISDHFDIEEAA